MLLKYCFYIIFSVSKVIVIIWSRRSDLKIDPKRLHYLPLPHGAICRIISNIVHYLESRISCTLIHQSAICNPNAFGAVADGFVIVSTPSVPIPVLLQLFKPDLSSC